MSVCIRSPRLTEDGFPSPNAFDGKMSPGLTKFTEREEEFWSFSFRKQQPKCSENSASSEDALEFPFSSSGTGAKTERQDADHQIPQLSLENQRTENAEELKELVGEEKDAAVGGETSLQCDKTSQEQDPKTVGSHPKEKIHPSNSRKSFANTKREETQKLIGHCSSNKPSEKIQDLMPRRKPRQKVKVGMQSRSPQTASRAEKRRLRDLKKKKKKKGSKTEQCRSFESFAVAKSSFDPQKDFRESMVEMILENRIEQPQELESLLACYLSLNSAEHHDVIVKAFQHVWLELNRSRLISELEKGYENYE
ncbi:hypothetical protein ACLOJK_008689 [Asimina triloba]